MGDGYAGGTIPEEPEIYEVIRRSNMFGVPYFEGGWHEWPHIFVAEMEQAMLAERTLNREIQAMHEDINGNAARTPQNTVSALE